MALFGSRFSCLYHGYVHLRPVSWLDKQTQDDGTPLYRVVNGRWKGYTLTAATNTHLVTMYRSSRSDYLSHSTIGIALPPLFATFLGGLSLSLLMDYAVLKCILSLAFSEICKRGLELDGDRDLEVHQKFTPFLQLTVGLRCSTC